MTDAFISYPRKDKSFVELLCVALASQGRKAWVDWDGIPPSAEWMNEIQQAIDAAQSFIFVVSPNSAASKVCGAELAHALANNKRIIPILRGEVEEGVLPKSIEDRNWIWCRDEDPFEAAVAAVISSMDTDLEWVRSHTRLLGRAHEWAIHKRNAGYALHGADLRAAEESVAGAQGREPALSRLQVEYILASRGAQDRRRRRLTVGTTVVTAAVAILGVLYWATERESRHNLARDFHDAALSALVDRKFGLAEVLLARGLEIDDTKDTRQRLLEARARTAKIAWMSPPPLPSATIAAISPDGGYFAQQIGARIAVWKVGTSQDIWSVGVGGERDSAVAFSNDGLELAIGHADDIALWDLASEDPEPVRHLHLDPGVGIARLTFSAGRKLLAVATRDKRILVFDLASFGDQPGIGCGGTPTRWARSRLIQPA